MLRGGCHEWREGPGGGGAGEEAGPQVVQAGTGGHTGGEDGRASGRQGCGAF